MPYSDMPNLYSTGTSQRNAVLARHWTRLSEFDTSSTRSRPDQQPVAALYPPQLWLHTQENCRISNTNMQIGANSVRTMLRPDPRSQAQLRLAVAIMFLCLTLLRFLCPAVLMFLSPTGLMFLCPTVLMFLCPTLLMFLCPSVLVFLCPTLLVFLCPIVLMLLCPTILTFLCPSLLRKHSSCDGLTHRPDILLKSNTNRIHAFRMMPCKLVHTYQRFGRASCLHIPGQNNPRT
jgi:hypothetical protein